MITLMTGLPGNGKTLYALSWVKRRAESDSRPVYYNGIKDLTLPWTHLDNPEEWYKVEPNAIIVIDEAQRIFRPSGSGSAIPRHISELETHRHQGVDLVIITQHPLLVHSNVRRLVGQHFHAVRKFGMQAATIHEWGEVKEQCGKNRADSTRHDFRYPREAYTWYKSAELHTHKRNIPKRVWFFLASPLIVGALIFGFYKYWHHKYVEPSKVKTSDALVATSTPVQKTSGGPARKSDADYFGEKRARIYGLPFTAPVYDELEKPLVAPKPAACILMHDKCACFTQQATKIPDIQDVICRQIVAEGYFDPTIQPRRYDTSYKTGERSTATVGVPNGAGER